MLQAYFDESGEHDAATGQLTRLHVGGVLASSEDWQIIDDEWRETLRRESVSVFHMKDVAHFKNEFKGWTEERRQAFLNYLLDILATRDLSLIDVSFPVSNKDYDDAYIKCMAQAINGACSKSFLKYHSTELSIVYARSPTKGHNTNKL
jgi:hypothetical protein